VKRLRIVPLAMLGLVVGLAAVVPGAASAQQQEPEETLPACGIRYPGGFDPNTVGVTLGSVSGVDRPERGPVSLRLESGGELYTVLAAPAWYWGELGLVVAVGDRVRVKGSKSMGADGRLYLVAQEIGVAGSDRTFVLRDPRGKPAWSGCGPGGCDRRGR